MVRMFGKRGAGSDAPQSVWIVLNEQPNAQPEPPGSFVPVTLEHAVTGARVHTGAYVGSDGRLSTASDQLIACHLRDAGFIDRADTGHPLVTEAFEAVERFTAPLRARLRRHHEAGAQSVARNVLPADVYFKWDAGIRAGASALFAKSRAGWEPVGEVTLAGNPARIISVRWSPEWEAVALEYDWEKLLRSQETRFNFGLSAHSAGARQHR